MIDFGVVGFMTDRAAEYFAEMGEWLRRAILIGILVPVIPLGAKAFALWNNEPD